eukprot:gene26426-17526_t
MPASYVSSIISFLRTSIRPSCPLKPLGPLKLGPRPILHGPIQRWEEPPYLGIILRRPLKPRQFSDRWACFDVRFCCHKLGGAAPGAALPRCQPQKATEAKPMLRQMDMLK